MLQAVVFDMDGLMVDSEPIWAAAWGPAFARRGLSVLPGVIESCVGSSHEGGAQIVSRAYDGDPEALAAFQEHFDVAAELFLASGAPKKPGLDELLDWLRAAGVPMAVASSSSRDVVEAVLAHAGVRDRFSVVVTGDDGHPSKPAPDIFLAAARRLGVDPDRTLVLEDSFAGVRAAHDGGFLTVMVPDAVAPTAEVEALCDCVCPSLRKVLDLLEEGLLGGA